MICNHSIQTGLGLVLDQTGPLELVISINKDQPTSSCHWDQISRTIRNPVPTVPSPRDLVTTTHADTTVVIFGIEYMASERLGACFCRSL